MDELQQLLESIAGGTLLLQATMSNVRNKQVPYTKVRVQPVQMKRGIVFQFSFQMGQQVNHENVPVEEAGRRLHELMAADFKQGVFQTADADYHVLVNKRGEAAILRKPPTKTGAVVSHNREKRRIIPEGEPVPFLVKLGVMNAEGKVLAQKQDKFRQINRFLEMVDDVLPNLQKETPLTIVDFGCGKSYLTFALYHYLRFVKSYSLRVTGLDLKEDVIRRCNDLAQELGYDQLVFRVGNIEQFSEYAHVDMVVTLHACDTATDAALERAVRWKAAVILSVPCCQHELARQVSSDVLAPMLSHGIIKERFSSLATDAIRAQLLEIIGYRAQIIEFIDMENTPKNLLIRAVRQGARVDTTHKASAYLAMRDFLNVSPYLERALKDELSPIFEQVATQGFVE